MSPTDSNSERTPREPAPPRTAQPNADPSVPLSYARQPQRRIPWDAGNYLLAAALVTLVLGFLSHGFLARPSPTDLHGPIAGILWTGITAVLAAAAGIWARLRRPRRRRIRLLSVAAITAFVGLALLPLFAKELRYHRSLAKSVQCRVNLRHIGQALHVYAADQGAFPADLGTLINVRTQTQDQFHCPVSGRSKPEQSDYRYVTGLTENDPSNWILAFDEPGNHPDGGGNILYIDGHVEYHKAQDFADELDRFLREFETSRGQPPTILAHELLPPNRPSEP